MPDRTQELRRISRSIEENRRSPAVFCRAPFFKVLEQLPERAPFHSIISDQGCGDTPNSSDSVVPSWTSHRSGEDSKRILPILRTAYDSASATAKFDRILRLDAREW